MSRRVKIIWRDVGLAGLMVAVFLTLRGSPLQAQQGRRGTDSDLARENLERVAASAFEIEAVLRRQPGLLVELKRWVAKEATDHGQIVSNAELADRAIYARLASDVKFRSVATQLLERYGYLVAEINPHSELGTEHQLVLQAKANRIAQAQAHELENSTGTGVGGAETEQSTREANECVPAAELSWEQAQSSNQRLDKSQSEGLDCAPAGTKVPSRQVGEMYASRIGPAGASAASMPNPPDFDQDTSVAPLQNLPFPSGQQGTGPTELMQTRLGASWGVGQFPLNSPDVEVPSNLAGSQLQNPTSIPVSGGGFPPGQEAFPNIPGSTPGRVNLRARAKEGPERSANPALVRRPNPYSDIPSLYDMYEQASPRSARLERFGMNVFENANLNPDYLPTDLPVGPEYVLGPGDGLTINLWGGVARRLYRTVDREGRVALPEAGPVLVSGRSMGEVQQEIQQILRTQFRDVSADVSLSRLRTIRVYVVGDVEHPGPYDISSLSTPLNALFAAGGPTSLGSLRLLRHFHGRQLVQEVDTYDLLLHGVRSELAKLEDGDTLLVPAIGPQVTIEGMVRRPAIYELNGERSLADMLQLSGGILPAASLSHIEVQRLEAHEKQTMLSLDVPEAADAGSIQKQLESFRIQDGDTIHVFPIAPFNRDAVYLEGHVLRPGRFSYRDGMKVTDLISSYAELLPEPSIKYAEIIRLNPPDYRPSVESFDLGEALANPASAPALQPLDTVRVYGRYDFQNPPIVSVLGEVRKPGTFHSDGQIHLRDAIQMAGGLTPDAQMDNAQVFQYSDASELKITTVNLQAALEGNPIDNILLGLRDRILVHRNVAKVDPPTVTIEGEVPHPGHYPLTTNLHVRDLIRLAGGLKRSADPEGVALTSYNSSGVKGETAHSRIDAAAALAGDPSADLPLREGDVLTIPESAGWADRGASIEVRGEVTRPGTYGIRNGDKLSTILKLAGGFRSDAYPYGAVLERAQVRELEEKSRFELIQRVEGAETELKNSAENETDTNKKLEKEAAYQQWQTTLESLTAYPPTGRLTIRVSSNIRHWENSPADIQVRNGDVLTIPKKPDYVMVNGQVFNPTAISYQPGKSANWYLGQAGGPTQLANKRGIFVIRADGNVIGAKGSGWWGGNSLNAVLQPGDTIVVPERALAVGPNWPLILSAAQLATSIAYTTVLSVR